MLLSYMLGNGWSGMLNRKLPRVIAGITAGEAEASPARGCEGDTTRFWRFFNRAFRRSSAVALLGAVVSLTVGQAAQNAEPAAAPLKVMVTTMYAPMAENLLAAAAMMPDDKYEFRATPDVRSFGQMIAHVAGSQFLYCSTAASARLDPALFTRLGRVRPYAEAPADKPLTMSRADLIGLLREGVDYCRSAHDSIGETSLLEPVKFGGRSMSRLQAFLENVAHNNEHYGNLVAYLRLNGFVPPSSARTGRTP